MGKGDKRTRRGKIFAGSYGKTRQKPHTPAFVAGEAKPAAAEKPVKKRTAKRVPKSEAAADALPETPQAAPEIVAEDTPPAVNEPEAPAESPTTEASAEAAESPTTEATAEPPSESPAPEETVPEAPAEEPAVEAAASE